MIKNPTALKKVSNVSLFSTSDCDNLEKLLKRGLGTSRTAERAMLTLHLNRERAQQKNGLSSSCSTVQKLQHHFCSSDTDVT